MKHSQLFTKTLKKAPKDEVSKNAQLLIRAGYVHKEMAGVYDLLPLGMKVVEKIKQIVREEMGAIGGTEMIMSSMQNKQTWISTKRWDDEVVDVWFKAPLKAGGEIGFGWSHEEPFVNLMKQHISSFRDLPVFAYQFQNKMRNELRAKSGLMRGREFVMKDMYSFCIDEAQHDAFYAATTGAYLRVFERLGLRDCTHVTFASGGSFTEFSHEFQTECEVGEDHIYINKEKGIAINEEVYNEKTLKKLGVKKEELTKITTAETGNIFNFGTEKCEQMGLSFTDEQGKKQHVYLGSYGIGITRLLGVIAERESDDRGLVLPETIAPFKTHLLMLGNDENVIAKARYLYKKLQDAGVEVLFDDRLDIRPGEKFADSDLIGIPYRVVVSKRSLENNQIELKKRDQTESSLIGFEEIVSVLKNTGEK